MTTDHRITMSTEHRLTWDSRGQPDLDHLSAILAELGVSCREIHTGTDDHEIALSAMSTDTLTTPPAESRRRQWAGALRWEADQLVQGMVQRSDPASYYAACLEIDAHRIEAGTLTPWTVEEVEMDKTTPYRMRAALRQIDSIVGNDEYLGHIDTARIRRAMEYARGRYDSPEPGPAAPAEADHPLADELAGQIAALLADRDNLDAAEGRITAALADLEAKQLHSERAAWLQWAYEQIHRQARDGDKKAVKRARRLARADRESAINAAAQRRAMGTEPTEDG